jgi:hypothetical protein
MGGISAGQGGGKTTIQILIRIWQKQNAVDEGGVGVHVLIGKFRVAHQIVKDFIEVGQGGHVSPPMVRR